MKTKLISLLVILVAALSCEESLQVEGPKIPDADKTVNVTLSNIPAGFAGGTVYLITLNNKGQVYAIQEAEAIENAVVDIAPVPGYTSFDVAAIIPTASEWSSKAPFTEGHYSRATAIQDKQGAFVTKTWTSATNLAAAPATGLIPTVKAELFVNGSPTPIDTDFTKGEIVTLDATVTDNIRSGIASVEFFLDATSLKEYTATPYRFQFNSVDVTSGRHWLYVKASNDLGHESVDSVSIFVSDVGGNVGPTISFTGVTNGNQYDRQAVVSIGATATDPDDGIEKVELRINDMPVGTDETSPYSFAWDTYNNNAGAVVLEITAYDKAGQSRSDVVNVTLVEPANYIPRATLTSPSDGATFTVGTATIQLAATAQDAEGDPINRVEFYYRKSTANVDTYLGQDATSPYAFTFNTAALTAGTYYVFARVFDNSGRSSYTSATITFQ